MRNGKLRNCKSYVDLDCNSQIETNDLIEAYAELLSGLEKPHWQLYLVTLGFNQMGATSNIRKEIMRTETVNMFNKLLTRFFRRPRSEGVKGWLPVGIFMFDMPVQKTKKKKEHHLASTGQRWAACAWDYSGPSLRTNPHVARKIFLPTPKCISDF